MGLTVPLIGLNMDSVPFMMNNVPPFHRHGTRGSAQSGLIPDVSTEDKAGKTGRLNQLVSNQEPLTSVVERWYNLLAMKFSAGHA